MDRISRLPDEVICHILSFLPTKHAVATSVLSSRWVNLWTFVPIIDLDDSLYLNPSRKVSRSVLFIRFMNMVLSLNHSPNIVKFRLYMRLCHGNTSSEIDAFIRNVFLRNVVQVDLGIYADPFRDGFYVRIPHSQTLKVLKVRTDYALEFPAFPGCFPSLRVFDVDASVHHDDAWITHLFPCLPALEKLSLVGDLSVYYGKFKFNIVGAALKHLELQLSICDYDECDATVVIDAPKLEYLRLQDWFLPSYLVKNKPAIGEVRLDVGDYDVELVEWLGEVGPTRLPRFIKLLQSLVNTKFISVSASTLKVVFSQRWNLPVLPSFTKLELDVPASCWMLMLYWLESFPNLKVLSLIIKEEHVERYEEVARDVVPSCLSSCVKEIKIKRIGKVDLEKVLIYLLYNAKVLDNFTVDSRVYIKDGIVQ